jgi:hypothetical protein
MANSNVSKIRPQKMAAMPAGAPVNVTASDLDNIGRVLNDAHTIFRALYELSYDRTDTGFLVSGDTDTCCTVINELSDRGCLMLDTCTEKIGVGGPGNFRNEFETAGR